MVVVVVIGILALLAVPAFERIRASTRVTRFVSDLRTFSGGLETLMLETGMPPGDPGTGELSGGHPLLPQYVSRAKFEAPTSLGGRWDIDAADFGARALVGVDLGGSATAQQLADLTRADRMVDDGDLGTGLFRNYQGTRRGYRLIE